MSSETIAISVLLPTRGRPREFARAVDSLLTTAAKPSAIQVLAYVDNDDPSLAKYPSSVIVGPRYGYPRLFEAIANHLIPLAKGDWLLLFNDDAHMKTKHWDELACRFQRARVEMAANLTFFCTCHVVYDFAHQSDFKYSNNAARLAAASVGWSRSFRP